MANIKSPSKVWSIVRKPLFMLKMFEQFLIFKAQNNNKLLIYMKNCSILFPLDDHNKIVNILHNAKAKVNQVITTTHIPYICSLFINLLMISLL